MQGTRSGDRSEEEVLADLRKDAGEAERLFSNEGQELQERTVVAGLLRVLGVSFAEDEIIKQGPEPVDICFRDARFQVTEVLDPARARDREIRDWAARVRKATQLEQLTDRLTPDSTESERARFLTSQPISPEEVLALVSERSIEKARKYGASCQSVDLLIYLNLRSRHLSPEAGPPVPNALASIGWRSIAVIMERVALVPWVASDAPAFLISHQGTVAIWPRIDSVFPRLGFRNRDQRNVDRQS